jgi:hypothetical protein
MTETSEERSQRLAALRAEAISAGEIPHQSTEQSDGADVLDEDQNPELKFRNYRPKAKELAECHVGGIAVPDVDKATDSIRETVQKPQVLIHYCLIRSMLLWF